MQAIPKGEMTIRGSLSPSSRFQSLAVSALEKGDRHARERVCKLISYIIKLT